MSDRSVWRAKPREASCVPQEMPCHHHDPGSSTAPPLFVSLTAPDGGLLVQDYIAIILDNNLDAAVSRGLSSVRGPDSIAVVVTRRRG